jgi:hypothetical protein
MGAGGFPPAPGRASRTLYALASKLPDPLRLRTKS